MDKSNLLSIFTNKVLLEYSRARLFSTLLYGSFHVTMAELNCCKQNPKYLTGPLQKSLPPTFLKQHQ